MRSIFSLFQKDNFRKLWLAQFLSQVAANMLIFALILHIYDLTKSATTISLVIIATSIPSVIFGPLSGVLSDRVRYKRVLLYTNVLRTLAAFLLIPATHNTLAILEIIFVMSAITQFFSPAELSSIPLVVDRTELVKANSIYMTTMYGSLIFGYGIAGPLQGAIGSIWLFVIVGAMFLISSISIFLMSEYDDKAPHTLLTVSNLAKTISAVWQETKNGVKYVSRAREISSPMARLAIGWAMLGAFIVLLPPFAEQYLLISAKMAGVILIVPAGFGLLTAAYLLNKNNSWNKSRIINWGFVVCGLGLLVMASYNLYAFLTFSLLIPILLMVILGFCAGLIYIASQTLLQLNSAGKMRGRVFGIAAMLINLAMGVPALFVGGIADLTSPVFTLVIVALLVIIYGTSLFFEDTETRMDNEYSNNQ